MTGPRTDGNGRVVALAGASGLVGGELLQILLNDPRVQKVISLARRALPLQHEKLQQVVVDFADADGLMRALPAGISDAFCCLGTTRKQAGSADAFVAVDYTACLHFAHASKERGAQRFVLVSSLGADATSSLLYPKTKGQIEDAVQKLGFAAAIIVRPSMLDGKRAQGRFGEELGLVIMRPLFSVFGSRSRYAPIRAAVVARAMWQLALTVDSGNRTVLSDELQRLGQTG